MGENIQIHSNAGKKPRITDDDNGEDIISNLPESIISRILSLLPTKDVLRTCVLSKDWEYKWTGIYKIDIDDGERFSHKTTRKTSIGNFVDSTGIYNIGINDRKASIVNFVDRIFFLSRSSTLKRFRLLCRQRCDAHRMISWISAALMRNVEDLEIVYNHGGVVLPRCLFYCTSLTKLKLHLPCTLRVPIQNWLTNLKILYLVKVEILNECTPNTSQLILDFPVLETFELHNCEWLKVNSVEIHSPALTNINVIQYSSFPRVDKFKIKISGAKLVKFEFCGWFVENFDLSTSSVFSATVDFRCNPKDILFRISGLQARFLLKGFSGLNHLKLSGDVVEAVAQSEQGPPLPKFDMLKQLELTSKCNSGSLLDLLHAMPFLESIILNMLEWDDYDYDEVESVPSCIVSHLNEVQFHQFRGRRSDVRVADFFLTNALQLKKMLGLCKESSIQRQIEKQLGWRNPKKSKLRTSGQN